MPTGPRAYSTNVGLHPGMGVLGECVDRVCIINGMIVLVWGCYVKCVSMGMCLHVRGNKSANEDPFFFSTFFSYFIMFQGIFFNPPLSRSLILMLLNAAGVHPNPCPYPCGGCRKSVTWVGYSVACSVCGL